MTTIVVSDFDADVIQALADHMNSWEAYISDVQGVSWNWTDAASEIMRWYREYYKVPQIALAFRHCEWCDRAFSTPIDDPSFLCQNCREPS